jgi:endonuclease YncB( thermonuclease family)
MKKLLIIILVLLMLISGCNKETSEVVSQTLETTATPTEQATATPQPTMSYAMPELPDLDFAEMEIIKDGYEQVEFVSLSDGDTATFKIGGMPMAVRFLAVDTPEMNSSTDGMQPWAMAAKEFTKEKLKNAETIILELDEESDTFDKYSRLLAWVWVDGELLNYMLVEEGLAYVKYLYGDYKYNDTMIVLESKTQKEKIKIWGEDDPDYDYDNETISGTLGEIREQVKGKNVSVIGVVTNTIDKNAFIQDDTGAVYIYANKYNYSALEKGNKVQLEGKLLEYNGLLEISNIVDKKITLIEEGIEIEPKLITLDMIGEDIEGQYIKLENLTVQEIITQENQKGYDVVVTDGENVGLVRVDKYLKPYPEPGEFEVGEVITVIGNIGQFLEEYQIMIGSLDDVYK